MTVDINCPNCNFSKKIPREKIPEGVRWATCPRCRQRFEFALPQPVIDIQEVNKLTGSKRGPERLAPPWENRSELGIWKATYQTLSAILFSPKKFFSAVAFKGGIKEPLAFGLLIGSIGAMFGLFWQFLIMIGSLLTVGHELFSQFTMTIIFLGIIIISPVFVTIGILLTSSIIHLLLLIVRGGGNGFEATFRVISYSQATQAFGLIPIIGGMIGGIWLIIAQIIGLKEIHETSYFKIIIALLIPLAFIFLLALGVVIILSIV